MNKTSKHETALFKPVYLMALFPILSAGLYILLMGLTTTEDFSFGFPAIVGLIAICALWGFGGALFARSKTLLLPATLISHIIPIVTTVVYTLLMLIAQFTESESLQEIAELVGGLGTGFFGVIGTLLYALIPMSLFEVYINFGFMLIVFIIGYTIGTTKEKK